MSSNQELIQAHLNLYAILQNLEELSRLDDTARAPRARGRGCAQTPQTELARTGGPDNAEHATRRDHPERAASWTRTPRTVGRRDRALLDLAAPGREPRELQRAGARVRDLACVGLHDLERGARRLPVGVWHEPCRRPARRCAAAAC